MKFLLPRILSLGAALALLLSFTACEMPDSPTFGMPWDTTAAEAESTPTPDEYVTDIHPETETITEPATEPDTTPGYNPDGSPVLVHTFTLSGPYDVKGGYVSGTASPSANIVLTEVFDVAALAEAGYYCRVNLSYQAAVQGDHLNLRFSMALGGVFVLVDDYRYLNHNESTTMTHGAYAIPADTYGITGVLSLNWDTKGVTDFDGINHCKVSEIAVTVEFYREDTPEDSAPESGLVTEYDFILPGSYTTRGGYISGTTTPSVSVDLTTVFDLQTLADEGYTCGIEVYYTAEVQGDHLNLRCTIDGTTVSVSDYVYLDHNEKANMGHAAYNISAAYYKPLSTIYLKWDCKGVTVFDGLNECVISNVRVHVHFIK
jgi:hypothetical protein